MNDPYRGHGGRLEVIRAAFERARGEAMENAVAWPELGFPVDDLERAFRECGDLSELHRLTEAFGETVASHRAHPDAVMQPLRWQLHHIHTQLHRVGWRADEWPGAACLCRVELLLHQNRRPREASEILAWLAFLLTPSEVAAENQRRLEAQQASDAAIAILLST